MSVNVTTPTVSEVLTEGREIIAVHSKDTVHQVIRALGENGIFSGLWHLFQARFFFFAFFSFLSRCVAPEIKLVAVCSLGRLLFVL
jgi:hypothetical protein